MAAAACKTCTNALASAPTTAATTAATASTPSRLTPPLPPTIFLTEDSPAFCSLQQQLNDQASALSDIATSLQHILTSLHNPEPWPPQPPSSQPVATTLTSTTLPAANTAGSALGAPLPGESEVDCIFSWLSQEVVQQVIHNTLPPQDLGRLCNPDSLLVDNKHEHAVLVNGVLIKSIPSTASTSSTCHFTKLIPDVCCFAEAWTIYTCIWACTTNDPNLSAGLGAFLLHVIQTDRMHTWLSVISYVLITCRQCFGHASAALWAQQDQAAWNQHLSTAASFHPPPKSATPGSANRQADTQLTPDLGPAQRPPPPQGLAWHIDGPAGPPDLSTPPLQGLAQLVSDSATTALPSINASISPGFIRIWYKGLQDLLAFVSQNLGCLLWKGDLEDAFQHVMTAECDMHLLSFSYDGICYCENKLTFGGSSSPWLFNLVAMFLHWLVTACLPTDWPINHYLDDTFSAIPVLHTVHALLPVHTLALAANALGLQLSPKKTFGASTKLEVLGVKIDTVAQTVGITNN
ncbi:uncharacterized protein UBRO2_03385 [Ustilago bromivora]|uniref:Reverse transcriptase domain-containing protein n=1 Tax=Ustilago bromivora TaxID=307758 RepID=A0A8H8QNQ7_9BASI|nr:uncharacterized protein UBRO2_03385 [Ustilago bromivora]